MSSNTYQLDEKQVRFTDKAILILVVFLSGCVGPLDLSTSPVARENMQIEGLDDSLESNVRVSTYDYYRPGILQQGKSDPFLRASISKSDWSIDFIQVYIRNNASDWRRWSEVRYQESGELQEVDVKPIGSPDVSCSEFGCSHYEDVGFTIGFEQVKKWANSGEDLVLRLVSGATSGVYHDMTIPIDEIKRFADTIDAIITPTNSNE